MAVSFNGINQYGWRCRCQRTSVS